MKLLACGKAASNVTGMERVLFLALFSIFGWQLAAAEPLFMDDFKSKLGPGWSWLREDKSAWRTSEQGLEIRIQPGNMWGPENSGKNVLIRKLPESERPYEISMTVEHSPTEQYEQVDLVAYFDDSNMVKIGEELVDGQLSIVMGREEKDRTRTLAIIPLEKTRVELKLRIVKGQVSGFFRPEGTSDWKRAGECELPGTGTPKIAIQCYQGTNDKEHWAKIQSFRVSPVE